MGDPWADPWRDPWAWPETASVDGEAVVTAELHLGRISDKRTRDVLRRAARDARHGPVAIVNRAGKRIGAIVSPEALSQYRTKHDPDIKGDER